MLWFSRKQKITLEQFVMLLVTGVLGVMPDRFEKFDADGLLYEDERSRLNRELQVFRLIVVAFLLLDDVKNRTFRATSDEVGEVVFTALRLALRDAAYSEESAAAVVDKVGSGFERYFAGLQEVDKGELEEKGEFFFLCNIFAANCCPVSNLRDEGDSGRNFAAFDAAKQTYRTVRNAYQGLRSEYKVVRR